MVMYLSLVVAVLAVLAYAAWKCSQINARGGCAVCHTEVPMYRRPTSLRQAFWGGWTCENCGSELDRHGMEMARAEMIARRR